VLTRAQLVKSHSATAAPDKSGLSAPPVPAQHQAGQPAEPETTAFVTPTTRRRTIVGPPQLSIPPPDLNRPDKTSGE
jgi:hypothetical protein